MTMLGYCYIDFQSRKKVGAWCIFFLLFTLKRNRYPLYDCAAFCTSLALLAGSGNSAGCNVAAVVERMAD